MMIAIIYLLLQLDLMGRCSDRNIGPFQAVVTTLFTHLLCDIREIHCDIHVLLCDIHAAL